MNRRDLFKGLMLGAVLATGLARTGLYVVSGLQKRVLDTYKVEFGYGEALNKYAIANEYSVAEQIVVFEDFTEHRIPLIGDMYSVEELEMQQEWAV